MRHQRVGALIEVSITCSRVEHISRHRALSAWTFGKQMLNPFLDVDFAECHRVCCYILLR